MGKKQKKYDIVYNYIREFIDENKFTKKTKIPSENFLCRKFKVSRQTVRTAIAKLTEENYVYSVRGSGTYFNNTTALLNVFNEKQYTTKIGLIIQGQDFNASSNLVQGIKYALSEEEIDFKLFFTDNKFANERKCLIGCLKDFDALIIDGVKASIINPNLDCYSRLYEKNIRMIFYNNYYKGTNYPHVIIDDLKCADKLIQFLVSKGHKHIAGFFVYDNYQGIEKYRGYVQSLIKYQVNFDDRYVKWCISDDMCDSKLFPKIVWNFIKSVPQCTAIVCCNYMILQTVLEQLQAHGKKVPEDYSIVSFDYSNRDWNEKGIASSIHPGFEMGIEVGQRILSMLKDDDYKKHDYSYVFEPIIYEGHSIKHIDDMK